MKCKKEEVKEAVDKVVTEKMLADQAGHAPAELPRVGTSLRVNLMTVMPWTTKEVR